MSWQTGWPHIPEVKERLALGDFQLGIALFAMAAGSVLALPFAGWLSGRLGSNVATGAAGVSLCVLLPAPVLPPSLPMLMLALLLFGAVNSVLDVSMNAQAVLVEDRYRRRIFSSLHGLYSTGGLAGAGPAALAASAGIPASAQMLGLTVLVPLPLAGSSFAFGVWSAHCKYSICGSVCTTPRVSGSGPISSFGSPVDFHRPPLRS